MEDKKLLEFYGEECPHCIRMKPVVERAEKELGVEFLKYEVWHNEENARLLEQYDKGYCGGVPFFYNTATNEWTCGAKPYEQFKAFAQKQ